MAKPTYYPDWATQTVTLPGTGNTNKIRPKETIRNVGMDFGQIMTCEEMNWTLNNFGLWVHYIIDELFPTLPNTYLPLVGTKITMAGDATGSVTWNGNKEVTLSIQVVDNSHNHLSSNITDATTSAVTPNVLVKRDGGGSIYAGDIYACGTSATDPATVFFSNFNRITVGEISASYNEGGNLVINRYNPANGTVPCSVVLHDAGYTVITNPRTGYGQEFAGNSLVRLDHLNGQVNNLQNNINYVSNTLQTNINNVNTNLTNSINNVNSTLQANINAVDSRLYNAMLAGDATLQNNINSVNNSLSTYIGSVNTNLSNSISGNVAALNNRITSIQSDLQNQITTNLNYVNGSFVREVRLGARMAVTMSKSGGPYEYAGYVLTGLNIHGEVDGDDQGIWRQLQFYRNGSWITVGQL